MSPEKLVQKIGGILIKSVVALSKSVDNKTEQDKELITTIALFDSPRDPASAAPMTTGKNGKIQGASTVKTPARTEMTKKIIWLLYWWQQIT